MMKVILLSALLMNATCQIAVYSINHHCHNAGGGVFKCDRMKTGRYLLRGSDVNILIFRRIDKNVELLISGGLLSTIRKVEVDIGFCPLLTIKSKLISDINVELENEKCVYEVSTVLTSLKTSISASADTTLKTTSHIDTTMTSKAPVDTTRTTKESVDRTRTTTTIDPTTGSFTHVTFGENQETTGGESTTYFEQHTKPDEKYHYSDMVKTYLLWFITITAYVYMRRFARHFNIVLPNLHIQPQNHHLMFNPRFFAQVNAPQAAPNPHQPAINPNIQRHANPPQGNQQMMILPPVNLPLPANPPQENQALANRPPQGNQQMIIQPPVNLPLPANPPQENQALANRPPQGNQQMIIQPPVNLPRPVNLPQENQAPANPPLRTSCRIRKRTKRYGFND